MTDSVGRGALRAMFDAVAERYDRIRPAYPEALFDDLAELASLASGSRVLEVGCGTGQATAALAARGYRVLAVELGSELAALARRRLIEWPLSEVVVADFETWSLPVERFEAVVFATAFHWIDPAVRMAKTADALLPGGAISIVRTHHVAGGSEPFFVAVQDCYERWDPATPPGLRLAAADDIPIDTEELDRSDRFGPVEVRRYEWDVTYSTPEYRDLLLTYSGHLALEPEAQRNLLACIGGLIDDRFGGSITKRYLTEQLVACRSAG